MKGYKNLKKALCMAIIAIVAMAGNNAFGQTATVRYSAIFADHYYSSNDLANDLEAGKLKMSESVTELFFINFQLQTWNEELIRVGAVRENGTQYQLESEFENIGEARKYFAKVLRNHCADQDAVWISGDYRLARAKVDSIDVVETDYLRGPKPGEKIVKLDPNSIPEVSQADGRFELIDGFSLYCGNAMFKTKQKPAGQPAPAENLRVVRSYDTVYQNRVVTFVNTTSQNNIVRYEPIPNPYDYQFGSPYGAVGGGPTSITYNVSNNGNTTNPAPVVMKNNNGAVVAAVLLQTGLTAFAIWQAGRWQQYQPAQYYAVNNSSWSQYAGSPIQPPAYPPIQGNAFGGVGFNPIQGNAGNVGYNPLPNVYDNRGGFANPIQGTVWP